MPGTGGSDQSGVGPLQEAVPDLGTASFPDGPIGRRDKRLDSGGQLGMLPGLLVPHSGSVAASSETAQAEVGLLFFCFFYNFYLFFIFILFTEKTLKII